MKLFKNYSLLMVAMLFASATFFTGCVEDPCADTICFNNGTCNEVDGSCDCTGNWTGPTCEDCPAGFAGTDCDECATGFSGANCDECATGFTGTNCDECAAGYEGADCDMLTSSRYIGTYDVVETCNVNGVDQTVDYVSVIAASSTNADEIAISNFWGLFVNPVVASVSGDVLTIANQDPDADGFTVSGTGTLDQTDGRITINYVVTDTVYGTSESCSAFYDL